MFTCGPSTSSSRTYRTSFFHVPMVPSVNTPSEAPWPV